MSSSPSVNKDMEPKPPNEGNNSFVKSVTSRMSGFLPTTITKWFSSPSSSKSNGSAPMVDSTDSSTEDESLDSPTTNLPPAKRIRYNSPGMPHNYTAPEVSTSSSKSNGTAPIVESTDSSTEDEAPESLITNLPPSKRMRYNSPGMPHNYTAPETKCMSTNTESIESYSDIQSPKSRNIFRSETNFVSTRLHSSSEESSSSGNKKYTPIYNLEKTPANENNSVTKKRKSLFNINHDEKYASNITEEDANLPRFKPIQFASPFYNTRTRYSGTSSTYMNQPNIRQRKNALVTKSSNNDNNAISQSAKEVLDLLENYSSPLIEAKRISQLLNNTTNDSLSISSLGDSSANNSKKISYKTQELHVPSFATILRIKQRSRLMNTTSAIRQLIASHSSSSDFKSYPQSETQSSKPQEKIEKSTTKIKSRLTRINREEKDHQEINEPINLPTAVLQIDKDNLPKFSLSKTTSNSLTTTSTITTSLEISTNTSPVAIPKVVTHGNSCTKPNETTNSPEKAYNNSSYQFASPVTVSNENITDSSIPKFTFGSPERNIVKYTKQSIDDASSDASNQVVPEKTDPTYEPENWKCNDCCVFNNRDAKTCVCCAGKKPVKDKINPNKCITCNVVLSQGCTDKCSDCQKKNKIITEPISTDKTQWKCQDCWVMNEEGEEKCVCCGSKKPGPISSATKPDNNEGYWKCEICWIKNKSNTVKCAACDVPKPTSKSVNSKINSNNSLTKSKTNPLKNIIKSQSAKWECSNCLVRNEYNVSKCVCCETSKPGSITESEKKSFNFGVLPNTTFKFGIDPKPNNVDITPTSAPVTSDTPAMESETFNNSVTTFTFGLPKKNQKEDSFNKEELTSDKISKPVFTFGIPKQDPTELANKSDFNISAEGVIKMQDENSNDLTKKDEEDVMKIRQSNQSLGGSQPVNLFIDPNAVQPSEGKDNPFQLNFPSVKSHNDNIEKSELVNNINPLMVSTFNPPAETTTQQSTFSFSSTTIKPSLNFFTPQVTVAVTTNITFSTSQSPPAPSSLSFFQKTMPASTSSISFFQKNVSTPSTLSLFNKAETTVTTASQPVSNTPLFNFGSNNMQNNMTQPEKPKFGFTFGSNNKPETPSLFKTPFASSTDTIGNFSMTNSNAMNTGNMLSENTLGGMPGTNMSENILSGGNILSTENQLSGMSTGNGLEVGNSLSGNVLSSNTMSAGNNLVQPNNSSALASTGLFGSIKKENLWSSANNTSNNMFMTNVMDNNNVQKPPSFSFGSSVNFNSNNANSNLVFGSPSQPSQNVFGMSRANSQPSLFSNQMQSPAPQSIFGTPQPAITNNPAPSVGMFGTPNVGVTPTFGSPNPVPSFESSMHTTPAPAFNFGAQQPTGVFGFGQQQHQQHQQPQQQQQQVHPGGVYNFGATPTGMAAPQVQFNMGTAPNIPGRRVRRAVRRSTLR